MKGRKTIMAEFWLEQTSTYHSFIVINLVLGVVVLVLLYGLLQLGEVVERYKQKKTTKAKEVLTPPATASQIEQLFIMSSQPFSKKLLTDIAQKTGQSDTEANQALMLPDTIILTVEERLKDGQSIIPAPLPLSVICKQLVVRRQLKEPQELE